MLKVVEQYVNDIFKPFVTAKLRAVDRIDIVWQTVEGLNKGKKVEKASADGSVHQLL